MSAATASVADVSKTDLTNKDDSRDRNKSGQSQAQCTPMPLPALGTQRIIQGNGTNVGTVISLQCPARHKLIGSELMCVMGTNSTHWVGETYCKPMSSYENYGFRVAVLASIVSSAIIFLMSMAFITCCLVDCIKEDKKKKQERESDVWQWEEQAQHLQDNRSHYNHIGRNNNNNNTQEKVLSLWDTGYPAMCDNMRACRCHQQYAYAPACTYGPTPALSALPGRDYNQPLLPRNPESSHIAGPPPQYFGPPHSSCRSASPGLVQISAVGPDLVWQYGEQQSSLSEVNPSTTDESNMRNINPAKEFSIRIISV
ncbi:sushi domain-containing protein 3 [Micropterus dolomieu]|uniref:sushi domain-containing protein 3 n=1 Tax=Micropterus dolomieu TaxID=147949 RepID=UPI001E8CE374|nr:sushi domain-containing protein 3 [Micropterus dolomieu]